MSFSYAVNHNSPVAQDSLAEAEAYRVEKSQAEQEAKRALAGGKIKKKKKPSDEAFAPEEPTEVEPSSDVRYWQYSE